MFVDEARVFVSSGRGGDGALTFQREKNRPRGRPDGGSGGRGGSVWFVADSSVGSLSYLRDHLHQQALPGGRGERNRREGADAEDLELRVPPGTVIKEESGAVLADLAGPGDRFEAARGGRGGRGNASFVSPRRRAPGFAEYGEPGRELWLNLELRLIADVAVIGFPNAGKSTLVGAVSAAHPKVAPYEFTTLEPTLGVIERGETRIVICDVPGLVEGASRGRGLGLGFLRHANRASTLIHLLDAASGRDPVVDYTTVRRELRQYSGDLAGRPEIVALNKVDLLSTSDVQSARARLRESGIESFAVSAATGEGLEDLLTRAFELAVEARAASFEGFQLYRSEPSDSVRVSREDQAWRVRGDRIERLVAMYDLGNPEALAYLQRRLEKAGIEEALARAGAHEGDEVRVGRRVFEWWPAS